VLVAIYIEPETTKDGIILSAGWVKESVWQSTVGLVLKKGNAAVKDEPEPASISTGRTSRSVIDLYFDPATRANWYCAGSYQVLLRNLDTDCSMRAVRPAQDVEMSGLPACLAAVAAGSVDGRVPG
jgi:hypothetical protein